MRKYLSILCGVLLVGILAISFTSCSKEEKVSPKIKTLKFDVKVTNGSPLSETKAVKTGWVTGDKMYAFFNVSAGATTGHLNAIKYVTLTYNGTGWDGELSGELTDANEIGTAGTMYAVYFPFGGVSIASDGATGVTFKTSGNTNEALNGQPVYTYYMTDNTEYTVSSAGVVGTLHANFNLVIPDDYVYFFVNKDGEKYNSNEKYRLSAQGVIPTACSSFSAGTFSETSLSAGHTFWGYTFNDAGIAFSGKIDGTWASSANHRFYLYTEEGGTLSKTFTKTLSSHKSVNLSLASGWVNNGYRGYEISKGFLIRNNDGTYSLTPGNDPFEINTYFGKNENKNKVYFQFSFLKGDDELGADGNNINATSAKLPSGWKFPSACYDSSDWIKIVRNAPSTKITIQKNDESESEIGTGYYDKDKSYAFVRVTKDAKTYFGMVLFRDGSYIPKEGGIQYWGTESAINAITYSQLQTLIDAGCLFFPSTGEWVIDSWRYINDNSSVECDYMSSTYNSGKWYFLQIDNFSSPSVSASCGSTGSAFIPVRLVKTI